MRTFTRTSVLLAIGMVFQLASSSAVALVQSSPTGLIQPANDDDDLSAAEMAMVRAVEIQRQKVIEQVIGSVVCIYGHDRQGGGSGVIIDPSGIALTNHHVIAGAGMTGLGGLNDGVLYEWDLIGTDPGGDVAIIKLKGLDSFPYSPLGDSDLVRIGDWALAMGNPFLLAHDQVPTVTLGVVSGVERFQEGAGSNQLVYGNCIQVDSSINPGNSGGPLFNMNGEVIGINGRGSFQDRGRVNVGLGYAICANQIKYFIPDLLATKLVEHGTLDAGFTDRDGKVVCSTLNLDAPVATAGLEIGDELLEFEGRAIRYANQFKNLICTFPEDWPASLVVRKSDGRELQINVRLFGLPYNFSADENADEGPDAPPGEKEPPNDVPDENPDSEKPDETGTPDEPKSPTEQSAERLKQYLLSEPGMVVNEQLNRQFVDKLIAQWSGQTLDVSMEATNRYWRITDTIQVDTKISGEQSIILARDGRFRIEQTLNGEIFVAGFDGDSFWKLDNGLRKDLTLIETKTNPSLIQAVGMAGPLSPEFLGRFGRPILDGGDKALGQLSSRVMFLDEKDDWLYCWLGELGNNRIDNPDTNDAATHSLIRKISSDRDCRAAGGITFSNWQSCEGLMIPWTRTCVNGLDERPVWTAQATSCEIVDLPMEGTFQGIVEVTK